MGKTSQDARVAIWPIEGLLTGSETESRDYPLIGHFAVCFGKGHLERALAVWVDEDGKWNAYLDGFLIAPPSASWQDAFGDIWKRAEKTGSMGLFGRKLSTSEYYDFVQTRRADEDIGIDLSTAVDLNKVDPIF